MGAQNNSSILPEGSPKLEVVFDASVLGYAQYGAAGRTGVFRVADNLARELLNRSECELYFCAAENFRMEAAAREYLQREAAFRQAPTLGMSTAARAHRFLERYFLPLAQTRELPLPARALRRGLGTLLHGLEQTFAPLSSKALRGKQIYHSSFFALPAATRGVAGLRRFLTVCDVINLRHPEFSHDGGAYLKSIIDSVGPQDWVMAISETTKQELCEYRPDLDPARVAVVPLAASSSFAPVSPERVLEVQRRLGLHRRPYFLSVCTLDKRKNLDSLVKAFALWTQECADSETDLVLCGSLGDSTEKITQQIARSGLAPQRVRLTGYVADADLAPLYVGARAFVYPSLYEGFGLPVLEAMQCGVPVITSNRGALQEVAGAGALGVDVSRPEEIAAALQSVTQDSLLREKLSAAGLQRAKAFSWSESAARLLDAYRASG